MMNHVRLLGSRMTAVLLIAVLATGCSTTINGTAISVTQDGPSAVEWDLSTPAGLVPATLSAGIDGVLVGGATTGDPHQPRLAVLRAGSWQDVPAAAATVYGGQATIVRGAMSQDGRVVAIGTVTGGAHLNPRWSAWIGTTAGVSEEPQTVETFGGPEAGGITGVVSDPDPMVVGTWSLAPGVIGVANWLHQDRTWLRQPSPPVLAGAPNELSTATAVANSGSNAVIGGLATTFRAGIVHQQALLWVSKGQDDWARFDLDTSDEDSAVTDVSCATGSCLAVGRLGDRLAAWRVALGGASIVVGVEDLPDRQLDHYAGQPRVGVDATAVVIAPGTSGEVLVTGPTGWTSLPAPAGEQRQVGINDGKVYLLLRPSAGPQAVYARSSG